MKIYGLNGEKVEVKVVAAKETKTKKERTPVELKSNLELAKHYRTLLRVSNNLEIVKAEVAYQGKTFTVAKSVLTFHNGKVFLLPGF